MGSVTGGPDSGTPNPGFETVELFQSLTVTIRNPDQTPRSVLAACCPEIVIRVDSCTATTARSPRTLVIRATSSDPATQGPPPEDVDVVWWFGSPAELVDLALHLGARA